MPLIKVGGYFIALKGDKGQEELNEAKNLIDMMLHDNGLVKEESKIIEGDKLNEVAKIHFKNTEKILDLINK